ncbi:hypothetical protein BDW59DRAFT_155391 [Aspergillus cavernicola]|uniref:RmlC-like cupin domain-containing protein n=1 Tax=Aspergillus cavernicola TaxID=176166 RepID=A0ABR4H988_9EURO
MQKFHHLQVFHDKDVEDRIRQIIPLMDNWLDGTLPLPKDIETGPEDPGVVFPIGEIHAPLSDIKGLIYSGSAEFSLIRTYKDTSTPWNLSNAVYTVLRGTGKIGNVEVTPGESIWVAHPAFLSATLILTISKPAEITVGQNI